MIFEFEYLMLHQINKISEIVVEFTIKLPVNVKVFVNVFVPVKILFKLKIEDTFIELICV